MYHGTPSLVTRTVVAMGRLLWRSVLNLYVKWVVKPRKGRRTAWSPFLSLMPSHSMHLKPRWLHVIVNTRSSRTFLMKISVLWTVYRFPEVEPWTRVRAELYFHLRKRRSFLLFWVYRFVESLISMDVWNFVLYSTYLFLLISGEHLLLQL